MTIFTEEMEEVNMSLKRELKLQQETIKLLREQIYKQELRLKQYESIHLELYSLKIELLDAKSKIEENEHLRKHLETTCRKLNEENILLKYPNNSFPLQSNINNNFMRFHVVEEKKENFEIFDREREFADSTAIDDGLIESADISEHFSISPDRTVGNREPTLAEKLKQTLSAQQQVKTSVPPPKPTPVKPAARVVVKEIPTQKPIKNKTKSLMVCGLYRGLKNDDLVKYFSQFGSVAGITCPPCVSPLDDGFKYAFIKFTEYDAVEKAMVQQFHIIKGIKLNTKKAKDFV